jgi:hypothetical protein
VEEQRDDPPQLGEAEQREEPPQRGGLVRVVRRDRAVQQPGPRPGHRREPQAPGQRLVRRTAPLGGEEQREEQQRYDEHQPVHEVVRRGPHLRLSRMTDHGWGRHGQK